jgi:hypothetical protein
MLLGVLLGGSPPSTSSNPSDTVVWITTVILAVVTIFAALIPYWLERKQSPKKEITYQVILDTLIPSSNKSVVNIEILNTGNESVNSDDYEDTISFEFNGRNILSEGVLKQLPDDIISNSKLSGFFKEDADKLQLEKFLLHPGETITIYAELEGKDTKIEGKARIRSKGKFIPADKRAIIKFGIILPLLFGLITVNFVLRALSSTLLNPPFKFAPPDVVTIILLIFILFLITFFVAVFRKKIKEVRVKGIKLRW